MREPPQDGTLVYESRNITKPWLLWIHDIGDAATFPGLNRTAQVASVPDGSTIAMDTSDADGFLRITGGPYTNLTIQFPIGIDGQIRNVFFAVAVPAITWLGSTSVNLPAAAVAGASLSTQRLAAGLWEKF